MAAWIPEQGSRMTEGRKTRTTPTMAAWIPGDAPRMTEKERHDTDNGGLDSRARLENDGGEKMRDTDNDPSPSPPLPRPSFSPKAGIQVVFFPLRPPPDGWEGREGLDSRAGLENDGGENHPQPVGIENRLDKARPKPLLYVPPPPAFVNAAKGGRSYQRGTS